MHYIFGCAYPTMTTASLRSKFITGPSGGKVNLCQFIVPHLQAHSVQPIPTYGQLLFHIFCNFKQSQHMLIRKCGQYLKINPSESYTVKFASDIPMHLTSMIPRATRSPRNNLANATFASALKVMSNCIQKIFIQNKSHTAIA